MQSKKDKKQLRSNLGNASFEEIIEGLTLVQRAKLAVTLMPEKERPGQINIQAVQKFCRMLTDTTIPFREHPNHHIGKKEKPQPTVKAKTEVDGNKSSEKKPFKASKHTFETLGKESADAKNIKDYALVEEQFEEKKMEKQQYIVYCNTLGEDFVVEKELAHVGGMFQYLGTIDNGEGKFRMFKRVGNFEMQPA